MKSPVYKIIDLFGNEQIVISTKKREKQSLFDDYDSFLDKFEIKKTTDDCYTPKEVMDLVVEYVNQKYPLDGKKIVRPFFPGGDYEAIEYTDDMVVIDNPPFSIITKICRYYIANNIKFFLFAPHLTAFGGNIDCTHIIASADIMYENGAIIKTSFATNLFGNLKIIGDADLCAKFRELQKRNKANLPKYEYPDNVVTVSKISYCVEKGVSIQFEKKDVQHCRVLDDQKAHGKGLFGSGFLCSDAAAAALAAAQAAAQAAAKKNDNVIAWELSKRELEIIQSLGGKK